jgi:hypothetical protein
MPNDWHRGQFRLCGVVGVVKRTYYWQLGSLGCHHREGAMNADVSMKHVVFAVTKNAS